MFSNNNRKRSILEHNKLLGSDNNVGPKIDPCELEAHHKLSMWSVTFIIYTIRRVCAQKQYFQPREYEQKLSICLVPADLPLYLSSSRAEKSTPFSTSIEAIAEWSWLAARCRHVLLFTVRSLTEAPASSYNKRT